MSKNWISSSSIFRKNDKHFFLSFYLIVIVSAFAIVLYSWGNRNWFTIISMSIILNVTSFLAGGLLGFIFGFPYSENEKHNKSFKDITEWLSKIIIGVGLIELKRLYHIFNVDVVRLSSSLGLDNNHSALFGALIISYSIMGFLIGYCVTITEIFKRLVKSNREIDDIKKDVKDILKTLPGPTDDVTVSSPKIKDQSLIEESNLKELISILERMNDYSAFEIPELKKLAGLLYRANYYEMAGKAYETVYQKDKSDYFSLLNAGYILSKKLFRHETSNQLLDKLIEDSPKYGAAYYNKACNYIRMNNFEKAKENIKLALTYDATLYAMAEKDEELNSIHADIEQIFEEIRGK